MLCPPTLEITHRLHSVMCTCVRVCLSAKSLVMAYDYTRQMMKDMNNIDQISTLMMERKTHIITVHSTLGARRQMSQHCGEGEGEDMKHKLINMWIHNLYCCH